METPNVAVVVTHRNGRVRCAVCGDIDILTAPTIGRALTSFVDIGETAIDLDLSQVEFMDSQGIRQLVLARRAGLRITVIAASPTVRRTLEVAGMDRYFDD